MDNKISFNLGVDSLKMLYLSYRLSKSYGLECCTNIIAFTAFTSLEDSPVYTLMISLGLTEDQIRSISFKILNEFYPLNAHAYTYVILNLTSPKVSITISESLFAILNRASEFANECSDTKLIGYNELQNAFAEIMPKVYNRFFELCNEAVNMNAKNCNIQIPSNLEGCLTVLNSNFSSTETTCKICGRDEETQSLLRILAKDTKRNAILVGEPGVGKTAIIEKLTWLIVTGNCPAKFSSCIIISLDINSIIAGTHFRGSAEQRFSNLIEFLDNNPNCILFIDEIHNLLGAGACRDGDLDLANALKPILARGKTQIIGATTSDEYNRYFSKDGALKRRFEKIIVKEPKVHEVYPMIENQINRLSKSHNTSITKDLVDDIIFYASCFNKETKNPDRTLDLIDRAMATAELSGKTTVDINDVLDNFNVNYKILENTPDNIKTGLAFHESGHYIVHRFSPLLYNYKTIALSIMPAENYYGAHVYEYDDDIIASRTLDYYIQLIACKLAGRVAENMYSWALSAGAESDLQNATQLAEYVITRYGLSQTFSTYRSFSSLDNSSIPLTREKSTQIDNEIDFLLEKSRMYAKYILNTHINELNLLVNTLLSKRMMSANELDALFFNKNDKVISTNSIEKISL